MSIRESRFSRGVDNGMHYKQVYSFPKLKSRLMTLDLGRTSKFCGKQLILQGK